MNVVFKTHLRIPNGCVRETVGASRKIDQLVQVASAPDGDQTGNGSGRPSNDKKHSRFVAGWSAPRAVMNVFIDRLHEGAAPFRHSDFSRYGLNFIVNTRKVFGL